MNANKRLDSVLKWPYQNGQKYQMTDFMKISEDTGIDKGEIPSITNKLVDLKYLDKEDESSASSIPIIFGKDHSQKRINFEGIVFYENAFPFKCQPFKSKRYKDMVILIARPFFLIVNGLAALFISYTAVQISNRTNELEEDKLEIQKQLTTEEGNMKNLRDSLIEFRQKVDGLEKKIGANK